MRFLILFLMAVVFGLVLDLSRASAQPLRQLARTIAVNRQTIDASREDALDARKANLALLEQTRPLRLSSGHCQPVRRSQGVLLIEDRRPTSILLIRQPTTSARVVVQTVRIH